MVLKHNTILQQQRNSRETKSDQHSHISGMSYSGWEEGVPRRQPHRRSGLATLPSVGAVP